MAESPLCPICGYRVGHKPGFFCALGPPPVVIEPTPAAGLERKKKGLDAIEAGSDGWVHRARAAARRIARERERVTADDVREWAYRAGDEPGSPNAYGAIFRGKEWVEVSFTQSKHETNNARRIIVWTLREP
jgi:hypothetical protein